MSTVVNITSAQRASWALALLQGMLSGSSAELARYSDTSGIASPPRVAKRAMEFTDALIAALQIVVKD